MRITDIETFELKVPVEPHSMAAGGYASGGYNFTAHVIVKIETDEGIIGYGESPCPYNYAGAVKMIMEEEIRPKIIGENPLHIEFLARKMDSLIRIWSKRGGAFATSGIEMALYEIMGKTYKIPLHMLLGGCVRDQVSFGPTLFFDKADNTRRDTEKLQKMGFTRTIKLKVGKSWREDLEMISYVRDTVGPSVKIRIDANQAWSPKEAIRFIRKAETYDLWIIEQPVAFWDLEGMAEVKASTDILIAADESCFTIEDGINLIKHRAADVFVVRIEETGGLLNCKTLVNIAESAGIPCIMGVWDDVGLSTIAKVHFIASSTNFPFDNDTLIYTRKDDILTEPLKLLDGKLEVPTKPGLGVEIDRNKLLRYKVAKDIYSKKSIE